MKYSRSSLGIEDNLTDIIRDEEQLNIFLRNWRQFNRDSLSWKII